MENINLGRLERLAFEGLQAREREIQRDYLQPLQDSFREFIVEVEAKFDVKIGETHLISGDGKQLIARADNLPKEEKDGDNTSGVRGESLAGGEQGESLG